MSDAPLTHTCTKNVNAKNWSADEIRRSMLLYAVTDDAWLNGRSMAECVQEALDGGATFIQLREKHKTTEELVQEARKIIPLCRQAGVPFVIDDDVEAARISGADGVHVGQSDTEAAAARKALGEKAIIGVSAQTVEQALAAQEAGATYLGVGAVFGTPTKTDAVITGVDGLAAVCDAVDIPVVAIGGLNTSTIGQLKGSGVDGVAVVSAIFAASDIAEATRNLRSLTEETLSQ